MTLLSPTLAIDQRVAERRAAGRSVVHLAFGEAGLPVLPSLAEVLYGAAGRNAYGPVAGIPAAREAAASYFARRGVPTDAEQVVLGPGSKPLLFALLSVLPGDVVVPVPCWVSYPAQARLAAKQVIGVPIPAEAGGVPDPDALRDGVAAARREGKRPGVLVLTIGDNPTGTVAPADLLRRVCQAAEEEDLVIVSDEIYADLVHDPDLRVARPVELAPSRTVVTSGLSKALALGGWRIGFARFPATLAGEEWRRQVVGLASEVWSSLSMPMQHVAAYALEEPEEVRLHVAASARLHAAVAGALHREVVEAGAGCRAPEVAFYLYPDLEPARERLAAAGADSAQGLADLLLERFDVAVLGGQHFRDDPAALRFRAATSLLYGVSDEERWETLRSPDPLAIQRVAEAIERVSGAVRSLLR
jgi:aspartate aminotransferase